MAQVKKHHARGWHWKLRVGFGYPWSTVKKILRYPINPFVYPKNDPFLKEWTQSFKKGRGGNMT